jgi:hypothetical protein
MSSVRTCWASLKILLVATAQESGHDVLPRQLAERWPEFRCQALGIPANARDPYAPPIRRGPYGKGKKQASGLNENYGRELMELHTLSVNGGYSQRDVTEVAKVFTGWTIEKPNEGGGFKFEPRMHEPGDKIVLGHRIKPKGEKEGLEVLHLLATNPKTAHFISQKLAHALCLRRSAARAGRSHDENLSEKDGDIREVLSDLVPLARVLGHRTLTARK